MCIHILTIGQDVIKYKSNVKFMVLCKKTAVRVRFNNALMMHKQVTTY